MSTSITKPDAPGVKLCCEWHNLALNRTAPPEVSPTQGKGAAGQSVSTLLRQLPGLVAAGVAHWWQVRRATASLAYADASMLRDLGVARSNIENAVGMAVDRRSPRSRFCWLVVRSTALRPRQARRRHAGDLVRVRELLTSGVPANQRGLAGTALHLAVATGRLAIAAALLDAGADLEAEGDPVDGRPLHIAAVAGKAEIAGFLIDRGANIEARDAEGRTPLMVAAAFAKTEVGALLVQAGADISIIDDMETAPIHHAAATGDADLVSLLLARGAGVNEQTPERNDPAPLRGGVRPPNRYPPPSR